MANNHYELALKQKVLRLYLEERLTKKSLNGTFHYNCTIIDLSGREAIATLNINHIDTELAKEAL